MSYTINGYYLSDTFEHFSDIENEPEPIEEKLTFDSYSKEYKGTGFTENKHKLSRIWQGEYKFEHISKNNKGGLTWWVNKIEIINERPTNTNKDWTIVRLEREDGDNFSLKKFHLQFRGTSYI